MSRSRLAPRSLIGLAAVALALLTSGPGLAQEDPDAAASPSAAPASPTPIEARPEGTWTVTAFDAWGEGLSDPLRGSTLTVSLLPAGRLEGETACGTYVGGYTVDGERIRLGVISKGAEPCGDRRADEDFALSQALALATKWAPSSAGLDLLDDDGRVRVALARQADGGVAGDWTVLGYARSGGDLGGVLEGTPATITFGADGLVAGSTGCRLFDGQYSAEADRIIIAPIDVVGLPCSGAERRQDRRLLELLDSAVSWQRDGAELTLRDASGGVLIESEARVEAPTTTTMEASPVPTTPVEPSTPPE